MRLAAKLALPVVLGVTGVVVMLLRFLSRNSDDESEGDSSEVRKELLRLNRSSRNCRNIAARGAGAAGVGGGAEA